MMRDQNINRVQQLLMLPLLMFSTSIFAAEVNSFGGAVAAVSATVDGFFKDYTGFFISSIFYSVPVGEASFPLIVGWLLVAAFTFTFYVSAAISTSINQPKTSRHYTTAII